MTIHSMGMITGQGDCQVISVGVFTADRGKVEFDLEAPVMVKQGDRIELDMSEVPPIAIIGGKAYRTTER